MHASTSERHHRQAMTGIHLSGFFSHYVKMISQICLHGMRKTALAEMPNIKIWYRRCYSQFDT